MKMARFSLSLLALLGFTIGYAQFPNVLISTSNSPEEVSIAINPKNTNQIVAGANLNNMYRSNDAGATWTVGTLACSAYGVWGDPVVIWDTANACYYMHLSNPPSGPGNSWIDRIVVQKSGNFGQTYTTCVGVGKNGVKAQDKEWMVVNPTNNEIHMTWTQFDDYGSALATDSSLIMYSKSSDGGTTWTSPYRLSFYAGDCIDEDSTVEGATPAVGPLGEVYVAWASQNGLMFQKSTNGGITWLPLEQAITATPGGWDYTIAGVQRCNGLPFTVCDLSNGPNKGTIYVNWSDQRNGILDTDIWLVKSTDNGATWSLPKRVNDDLPGKQQFMSHMTIDQVTGYLYVLFYDRRNYTSGNNTDVYLAVSKDGGNSFVNYQINANVFSPNASFFFGDYISVSAHNNVIRPIWMQMTNTGALSVWTSLVNPVILGLEDAKKDNLSILNAQPNPFKTETSVEFSLQDKTNLTVQLMDVTGKLINEPVTKKDFAKGNHKLEINAQQLNLKQGLYFLVIYGDIKCKHVKLLVE
ncbi:MAG: T9SS type A sorting domain-containing protein [Bacteroidia bacterium]|nr:T9SS type A sorting domain-containing protein [Bacteroidia bacterium]